LCKLISFRVIDTNRFVAYVLYKLTHLATAECRRLNAVFSGHNWLKGADERLLN